MTAGEEIELKLACELSDVAALARSKPLAAAGPPTVARLSSTYFDTHERTLAKAYATLRIRDLGDGRRVQTFKTRGDGLVSNGEWEQPTFASEPDVEMLQGTPGAALIGPDDALDPLFTVAVERSIWRLRHRRSAIEVAFDVGRVFKAEDPAAFLPVSEVELELKSGSADDLFDLAGILMDAAPLRLGVASKSARGHALLEGRANEPAHARPIVFLGAPDAGTAFRTIANACLTQLRLNEDLLVARRDPEALHQARVAARRLRSAFSLFAPLIEHPRTDLLKGEFKRLSGALGEARDIDVFLTETLFDERAKRPGEAGLETIERQLISRKTKAYDAALDTLRSAEWRRLVVDLAGWINAGAWSRTRQPARRAAIDEPAREFAARTLGKRRRKLLRRSRRIATIGDEKRHEARVEAKKLRYGCEFFTPLFGDKPKRRRLVAAFVKRLKRLQGRLGALNDAARGHELMEDAARVGRTKATAFAAGVAAADVDAKVKPLLREAKAARKTFAETKPFWD